MNAIELAEHAGITYRQVDMWSNAGLLHPRNQGKGTGHNRDYPPGEVQVAVGIAQLLRAGLTLRSAAKVARRGRSHVVAVWQILSQALEECA
jgi:DNA-binding transcriptional MerR regulator